MQTGQLLANLLGISRQAVHAHFQSGNKNHGSWALARVTDNLHKRLHLHQGISAEAKNILIREIGISEKSRRERVLEEWSQFEVTLRNGKKVQRRRDPQEAMKAVVLSLELFDGDDFLARMYRIAVKRLVQAFQQFLTGTLEAPQYQTSLKFARETATGPLFLLLGDPVPQFHRF